MKLSGRSVAALMLTVFLISGTGGAQAADLVDRIASSDRFKILTLAINKAGLVDVLKSKGPFTVFAPTDDAFGKLPSGMVESLLEPANRTLLRSVLKYHILGGKTLMATRIIEARNFAINTLHGATAEIDTKTGPSIENSRIIQADIAADNGVIHMIDAVILPPEVKSKIRQARQ